MVRWLNHLLPGERGLVAVVGAVFQGGAWLVAKAAALAVLPLITRSVTIDTFAIYALFRIAIDCLFIFLDLGTGVGTVRYVNEGRGTNANRSLFATLFWSRVGMAVLFGLAAVSLLHLDFVRAGLPSLPRVLFCVAGIEVFLGSMARALFDALRAQERHSACAMITSSSGIVWALSMLVLVVWQDGGLLGLLVAHAAGVSVSLLVGLYQIGLQPLLRKPELRVARDLFGFGVPLSVTRVAYVILSLDRYLIQRMVPLASVGAYQLASLPAGVIRFVRLVGTAVGEPFVYGSEVPAASRALNELLRRQGWLITLGGVSLALVGPEMLWLLGPPEYAVGLVVVPWLLAAIVNRTFFSIVGLGAGLAHRTRNLAIASFAEVTAAAGLMLLLVPRWGLLGAGLAQYGSSCVGLAVCIYLTARTWRLPMALLPMLVFVGLGALLSALFATPVVLPTAGLPVRLLIWLASLGVGWVIARWSDKKHGGAV